MTGFFSWLDAAPWPALLALGLFFIAVFAILWNINRALETPSCDCPYFWLRKQDGSGRVLKQLHDELCPNRHASM